MFSNYLNRNEPLSIKNKTSPTMELVKFINVKPKYCLNDDILLEYILDTKFQSTYRDFIGLYARGWNDLVQYITFEWIITHPNESSARRSTLFKSRYHSESVKLDVEYQFVYIDYKIEVMGRSQYFRFVPAADSIGNCKKNLQRGLSEIALTPSITLHSDPLSHVLLAPKPSSSVTKLDGYHRAPCFTQPQDQHLRGFSSEIALASAELPTFCTISAPNQKTMPCSICNQQFASHDHQKPDNKVKSSAAWINDLEHRNRSLEDRIQDLENELEMSLVTQKNLRLAAHHSKRDKLAYQKFVNELLHALSQKGIARVVDGQGTEMLVKRIPMKVPPADNSEERPVQNGGKTSSRERYLKAIIGSQEQKIRDLMLHLEATTKACHNLSLKMDLVAVSKDDNEDGGNSIKIKSTKHSPQSVIAVIPKGQGDTVAEPASQEEAASEDIISTYDGEEENNANEETGTIIKEEQVVKDGAIPETNSDTNNTPGNAASVEKPSAVVVHCDSKKYAVIRY